MANNAPLGYESLKAVIKHLDPNLRFKLAQQIPSLRNVEKCVPLRIAKLGFSDNILKVNDTTYQIGIYRDYPQLCHWVSNDEGGDMTDMDQWGFPDYSGEDVVTPGDVALERIHYFVTEDGEPFRFFEMESQESLEENMRLYKETLARRADEDHLPEVGPVGIKMREYIDIANYPGYAPEDRVSRLVYQTTGSLRYSIQRLETELQSYYCKRDNTPLPFTPKLQLTVESPAGRQVYLYDYSMKLHEARKNLATTLFGGRRDPIIVDWLNTNRFYWAIRLPIGLKLNVRNFKSNKRFVEIYEAMRHILQKFFFESLEIVDGIHEIHNCEHQILHTAKELIIKDIRFDLPEYSPIFVQLRNPCVKAVSSYWTFTVKDQINLIRNWRNTGRPLGTFFSYQIYEEAAIPQLLKQLKNRFCAKKVAERTVVIRMSADCCLMVSCRVENADPKKKRYEKHWIVSLQVQGTA